jgi:hypothetical protein
MEEEQPPEEGSPIVWSQQSQITAIIEPDYSWMKKLLRLQKTALMAQYQLAFLSTLGGAYHVCSQPKVAYQLACQQELVGRQIGSTSIVIRAKLFQYANLALLHSNRKAQQALKDARLLAYLFDKDMLPFCETIEKWVSSQLLRNTNLRLINFDTS